MTLSKKELNSQPNLFSKVLVKDLSPTDYQIDSSYTKEFTLIGKDKEAENIQVMRKSSIFNKNLKVDKKHLLLSVKNNQILIHKVSKCGQSGCKKEQLTPREVERVIILIFNYPDHTCCANNSLLS